MQPPSAARPAPIGPEPSPNSPLPFAVPPRPSRGPSRKWWVVAGVTVAAGLGWWLQAGRETAVGPSTSGGGPVATGIRSAAVLKGPIQRTIRLTGVTTPARYASLSAPMLRGSRSDQTRNGPSGNFTRGGGGGGGGAARGGRGAADALAAGFGLTLQSTAEPGAFVRQGAVVAEFDREDMLQRLDDYDASLKQSEASYQKMTSDVEVDRVDNQQTVASAQGKSDKAQLDLKSIPVLSAISSEITKLNAEEAQAGLTQVKQEASYVDVGINADLKVAELELGKTRLERQLAAANVDKMSIKSPIDGMVVMETTFRGSSFERIKAGDQLGPGQTFMKIVDLTSMLVSADVNQADAHEIRVGQRASISFDAYPGLQLPARVFSIGTMGQTSQFRPDYFKTVPVVLKLDKMDRRVIPDLSVSADVVLESRDAEAVVPREAVFPGSGKSSASPHVYLKTDHGWESRDVQPGMASNIRVAVQGDIKPGQVVALLQPPASLMARHEGSGAN